jgi:hypothetical protein
MTFSSWLIKEEVNSGFHLDIHEMPFILKVKIYEKMVKSWRLVTSLYN